MIRYQAAPSLARVIVAVDPNASSDEGADEAGITVHGLGADGRGYLLDDASARVGPTAWATRAVEAAILHDADSIVAEQNQGGEMVRLTIEQVSRRLPVKLVSASRGKRTRAEPVAMLYEQGRIFDTRPFPDLEDQLCSWTPDSGDSPDRLDANVWGWTELLLAPKATGWAAIEGRVGGIA
jgi:predicted phage terminase large subunit-like protein